MRIVLAPDSFKSSATAPQVCDYLRSGIEQATQELGLPAPEIISVPMADGGEGTAAIFGGEAITLPTTDANGRLIDATYYYQPDHSTAFIDVAAASGLPLVEQDPKPLTADTYGTGVLIADAVSRGATTICLGLGGSGTLDGGTGILIALGAQLLDTQGHNLLPGGAALKDLATIDLTYLNIPAACVQWVLLHDVFAPVTGPAGAAYQFGPQKGCSQDDSAAIEQGLTQLAAVCEVDPSTPGFGAAGALPVAITWLSRTMHNSTDFVHLVPGAQTLAEQQGLDDYIRDADLVITGEGSIDAQTAGGKVVSELIKRTPAHKLRIVAGRAEDSALSELPITLLPTAQDFRVKVAQQLQAAAREIIREYAQEQR